MNGEVVRIDPNRDPRWDAFVESHPHGWISHTSSWATILSSSFRHLSKRYLAMVDGESGKLTAGLALYEFRSWLTRNRLVSIPYTTLCDPLVGNRRDLERLLEAAVGLAEERGASYVEIRTLHTAEMIADPRFAGSRQYTHHYLRLDEDLQKLRKKFHGTSVRQRISRAEKRGLTVRVAQSEDDLRKFYDINLANRKRLGLPAKPYKFFQMMWRVLVPKNGVTLLVVEKGEETIGGMILLKFKERVSGEFLAWKDEYKGDCPSQLLWWHAIKSSHEAGYKVVDFGRTSKRNTGLMDFKRRWGCQVVDLPCFFSPARHVVRFADPEATFKRRVASTACRIAPQFISPSLGSFCYRHIG